MLSNVEQVIGKFLDQRDRLSDDEWHTLVTAVHDSPDLAVRLREMLVVDELLAQKLTKDRGNFPAQVDQRVRDYLRGEERLFEQVAELRSYALADLKSPKRSTTWPMLALGAALAVVILFGLGIALRPGLFVRDDLARIATIEGTVTLVRGAARLPVAAGLQLLDDDQLETGATGAVVVRYDDRTSIQLAPLSAVTVTRDVDSGGKRLFLLIGELAANVAPQPTKQGMTLGTPTAEVRVVGTEFSLSYTDQVTQLDVKTGRVEIRSLDQTQPALVQSQQSALATSYLVSVGPTHRIRVHPGALCLFPLRDGAALVRGKSSGWQRYALEPVGQMKLSRLGAELGPEASARLTAADAEIWSQIRDARQWSLVVAIEPLAASVPVSRPILSAGQSGGPSNFSLSQWNDRLILQCRGLGGDPDSSELRLEIGHISVDATHVIVLAASEARLICYLDGQAVAQQYLGGVNFETWTNQDLVLGSPDPNLSWEGRIRHFAVFGRAITDAQAQQLTAEFRDKSESPLSPILGAKGTSEGH